MLQYDLTDTPIFHAPLGVKLPNDAELFVVTAALLLVYDAAYSDLTHGELTLTDENLDAVTNCIEQRLPEFARDIGVRTLLRKRLRDLVGLRISSIAPFPNPDKRKPT